MLNSLKKDLTILIAGFGSIGRRHFNNLKLLGYSNFVFYRTNQSKISISEIEAYPTFNNLEEALNQKPDVVIISNPSAYHIDVALKATRIGCHLFIEKPLSHNLNDCQELQKLVKEKNLTVMIGCQFRFHPLLEKLQQDIQQGRIGKVIGADAQWGEYLPNWHPWEDYRDSYSARPDLGGGVVLTLIHPLDYLYWLFGDVKQVKSSIYKIPSLQTSTQDDWAEIILEFDSDVIAHVHLDYIQRPPVHNLTVWGDNGRVKLDFHAGTLVWESVEGIQNIDKVDEGFERNTMFIKEMEHFLTCIAQKQTTIIPLEDGIKVLEVALKAKQGG